MSLEDSKLYRIRVVTADVDDAGTDAEVDITLRNDSIHETIEVRSGLEKNTQDDFFFFSSKFSLPCEVVFEMGGLGAGNKPGWLLKAFQIARYDVTAAEVMMTGQNPAKAVSVLGKEASTFISVMTGNESKGEDGWIYPYSSHEAGKDNALSNQTYTVG